MTTSGGARTMGDYFRWGEDHGWLLQMGRGPWVTTSGGARTMGVYIGEGGARTMGGYFKWGEDHG